MGNRIIFEVKNNIKVFIIAFVVLVILIMMLIITFIFYECNLFRLTSIVFFIFFTFSFFLNTIKIVQFTKSEIIINEIFKKTTLKSNDVESIYFTRGKYFDDIYLNVKLYNGTSIKRHLLLKKEKINELNNKIKDLYSNNKNCI